MSGSGGDQSGESDDTGESTDVEKSTDVEESATVEESAGVERSAISDELDVPSSPPDPETTAHVLPDDKLEYPDFTFEDGSVDDDGTFTLEKSLDREEMREWLEDLRGGLASHDVGVSTSDETCLFGVGGGDVSVSFEPDDEHRGQLEFTFAVDAKLVAFSDDPEDRKAGARSGGGFIPVEMLTSDRDARTFRCYNWIDDPLE